MVSGYHFRNENPSLGRNIAAKIVGGIKNSKWIITANGKASDLSISIRPKMWTTAKWKLPIALGAAGTVVAKKIVPMITSVAMTGETGRSTDIATTHAEVPTRTQ